MIIKKAIKNGSNQPYAWIFNMNSCKAIITTKNNQISYWFELLNVIRVIQYFNQLHAPLINSFKNSLKTTIFSTITKTRLTTKSGIKEINHSLRIKYPSFTRHLTFSRINITRAMLYTILGTKFLALPHFSKLKKIK